jgi:6-phosphogluconolactonase
MSWGEPGSVPAEIGESRRPMTQSGTFAYVGTYTTQARGARGTGIHVYRVDPVTGGFAPIQHLGGLVNPSFLVTNADQSRLYAVHGDEDYATAFTLDRETGEATLLNTAATGGRNGVRQDIDRSGRFMVVANYSSGTVAVMAIHPDGSLADQHDLVTLTGELGPHRREQQAAHPHDIRFDRSGRFVLVPDKGLDKIFVFRFDAEAGRLTQVAAVVARSGSAPRHAGLHPTLPIVWVLNELDSTVVTYRWNDQNGMMTPLQLLSTLPENFTGDSQTAEIAVSADGRIVYCSNRGHASTAIFASDPETGLLRAIGCASTLGDWPRFIALHPSGRFLYATNERGDTITIFHVDAASGLLTPTGEVVDVASPCTIAFA